MSKWHPLYERLSRMSVNDVINYSEILTCLGYPLTTDLSNIRHHVYRAIQALETNNQRTMECVRGEGYRVIAASEHQRVVKNHMLSMKRKGRKALSKAVNVRVDELNPDERRSLNEMQLQLTKHEEMLQRLNGRVSITEKLTRDVWRETKENTAAFDDRLAKLEIQLAKLQGSEI